MSTAEAASPPSHAHTPLTGSPAPSARARLLIAILMVLAFAGYLWSGFLLDDFFLLGRAVLPFGREALRFAILTEDARIVLWPHPYPVHVEYFRPLVAFVFWVERRLIGAAPLGYHVVNLALHFMVTLLFARLAGRFGLRNPARTYAVLAWMLGLTSATANAWVAGMTELWWGLFAFGAALSFLRWRDGASRAWLALAFALSALAMCSKETAATLPILIAIIAALAPTTGPAPRRVGLAPYALLALPAAVFVLLRFTVIRMPLPEPPYLQAIHDAGDFARIAFMLPLQILSSMISCPVSKVGPTDWLVGHTPAALALVALLAALLVALARACGTRRMLLFLTWASIGFIPSLPVSPTSLYAYVPSAALALLVGFAWQESGRRAYRHWLVAWIIVGLGAHLVSASFMGAVSHSVDRSARFVEREISARKASRVLLVDAPVWTYGLPSQVRLERPDLDVESWVINFAQHFTPTRPSRLRWAGPDSLVMTSSGEAYFRSAYERFLSFGGTPERLPPPTGHPPVVVRPLDPGPYPRELVIAFRDESARDSSLIIQFDGWKAVRVIPPESSGSSPSIPVTPRPAAPIDKSRRTSRG